ncbi:uncharacterized protein IL334_007735 [Kwoniella shivajii]|uniref:Uncharacterized protein n=1 Tax=Kwoniella shivajii TaxID=564305 RepID=A0ABZ1DDF2_9TREE|nr:hypothetical protein IL334_007735 [Kwoniella shivajii]
MGVYVSIMDADQTPEEKEAKLAQFQMDQDRPAQVMEDPSEEGFVREYPPFKAGSTTERHGARVMLVSSVINAGLTCHRASILFIVDPIFEENLLRAANLKRDAAESSLLGTRSVKDLQYNQNAEPDKDASSSSTIPSPQKRDTTEKDKTQRRRKVEQFLVLPFFSSGSCTFSTAQEEEDKSSSKSTPSDPGQAPSQKRPI